MRRLVPLSLAFALACPAAALAASDFSGSWEFAIREYGMKNYYLPMTDGRLVLDKQGEGYVAHLGKLSFAGTAQKDGLHLNCQDGGKPCGALVLHLSGAQLTGEGSLLASPNMIPVTVSGKRPAARPVAASLHDYDPKSFQNFYTPFLAPVMRIFPGDSVKTRTLDSRGQDFDG
jgi:hypothetical protein